MDSPPIGSLDESVELLRIETNLFTMYIQGKPYHPTVESMSLHRTEEQQLIEAQLQVVPLANRLNITEVKVFNPVSNRLKNWTDDISSYPIFFETQAYVLVIEKKGGN